MDHYASLGVSRTSEDVVIRAAYLALMRRYHPDGNPSPEAAERVRAITTAYGVLGDAASRRDYDRGLDLAPARLAAAPGRGRRGGPLAFALTILCLAVLIWLSARSAPAPDRAAPATVAGAGPPAALAEPLTCLSPGARALSRRAVLRQASDLRLGNSRIAALPPDAIQVRTAPALSMTRQSGGAIECAAMVTVLLPRGLVAGDGEPTLHGEAEFLMTRDSRGAAVLVDLALDDRFLLALASVRRLAPAAGSSPALDRREDEPSVARRKAVAAIAPTATGMRPAPRARATSDPRSCSGAACADANVRELDAQLASFERQSLANADGRRRAALRDSRVRFDLKRASCATVACARAAILDQTVEVARIMTSPVAPPAP